MMNFTISAFGDEIAPALEDQLKVLNDLDIPQLDLRTAWGTNVLKMSDEQVARAKQLCDEHGVVVGCIGSPIGKSPLADPIENELDNLRRIMQIARALGTRAIRIFSFYPPDTSSNVHYDHHVAESGERLSKLTELAKIEDFDLLLENEKGVVGDTPERCEALMEFVNSPYLRLIWDPANFVQVGVAHQVERYWDLIGGDVGYVHIKDALLSDGTVKAAGEGDGQVKELLIKLRDTGWEGVLSLEPHLAVAGHSSGFSGVSGMTYAVKALRGLLATL
jgi:sugar phosphate isomerase/epimerase